jgi:hypothetical protein
MANRYWQSTRTNSGDWKFEVRDWPANWPRADHFRRSPISTAQRPRNAGLCAGHDEVSDFRECVAELRGFKPRCARDRLPQQPESLSLQRQIQISLRLELDHASSCSSASYRIGGSAFTNWIISGPVSPGFIACARIFSSIAALPTSPFNAAVTWRLIANSNLDVFLVRPFSRYRASPLRKPRTTSPISALQRLGRPLGLAQTPFLNWECRGGLP